ncbi:DinB family protein [Deinococcus psychrotolerans]|uniref:DinB family protein n=1 Tax=Deinococcus psychrotolerans TaxID=2489213 RepID=A0A3G8Y8Y1_9DEIO|nr:DinB family protein [Deinococcus psychrotolerans]AZI41363.1 DinB family protein [Deinococcus psychrotolerans]
MTTIQTFLADQYEIELSAFRAVLESIPEGTFSTARLGHSPAWHALHIADWLRLTVLEDKTSTYNFLGWEDQAWAQNLNGLAPVDEDADQAAILAHLGSVGAQAVAYLRGASDADLSGMAFSPSAPNGERPRLAALGMHLRHIAYHRGQVQLGKKA